MHFIEWRCWEVVLCWLVLNSSFPDGRWVGDSQIKFRNQNECLTMSCSPQGLMDCFDSHLDTLQSFKNEDEKNMPLVLPEKLEEMKRRLWCSNSLYFLLYFSSAIDLLCCSEQSIQFIHALQKKSIFDLNTGCQVKQAGISHWSSGCLIMWTEWSSLTGPFQMPFASGDRKQPRGIGKVNIFNVKISMVVGIL